MLRVISQNVPFQHPGNIPQDFAYAVYAIMHNKATAYDWEKLDRYLGNKKPVLDWIKNILVDNRTENIEAEMMWWQEQLFQSKYN